MEFNVWVLFVAALIPLITGAVWYNPKVFGNAWLKTSGLTEEEAQSGNMAVIFGLSYVFGLFWLPCSSLSSFTSLPSRH